MGATLVASVFPLMRTKVGIYVRQFGDGGDLKLVWTDGSPASYAIWTTAFAAVFSLYAHTFFGLSSTVVTPVIALIIAVGLSSGTILEISIFKIFDRDLRRTASLTLTVLAVILMTASTVRSASYRNLSLQEWGVFSLQVALPILLMLNSRRAELVGAIAVFCIGFSLLDALANFLAWGHLIELSEYSGRIEDDILRVRYPGISGNTHAAGLVAMVAIFSLTIRLLRASMNLKIPIAALIIIIFASLVLIDARRYTGMSAVGVSILLLPALRHIPAWAYSIALAAWAVYGTMTNVFDPGDDLRARLMISGYHRVLNHQLIGTGPVYVDSSSDQSGYSALEAMGVTESGFLDLAISYGLPAALLLITACLFSLAADRRTVSIFSVLLTVFTAEFAFGNPVSGFLSAILFYSSLIFIQQDESNSNLSAKYGYKSYPTSLSVS